MALPEVGPAIAPTWQAAAALSMIGLAKALSSRPAVSGRDRTGPAVQYASEHGIGWVRVSIRGGLLYLDDGAHRHDTWGGLLVTDEWRTIPGWPAREERALWAAWRGETTRRRTDEYR